MTTITSGFLPDANTFPEIVNGWTRSTPDVDPDARNLCGDYSHGPCLTTYYEKVLEDGRVVAIETTRYMETRTEDFEAPDAELFLMERDFFHSAPDRERFEAQSFDVEDYIYEGMEFPGFRAPSLVDGEVTDEDATAMLRHADVDDRECLMWDGEPIGR